MVSLPDDLGRVAVEVPQSVLPAVEDQRVQVARAKGAAEAQKIVRSTLSDSYLQYLWIKTLNENPNVIYVSTEANLPIFKSVAGR